MNRTKRTIIFGLLTIFAIQPLLVMNKRRKRANHLLGLMNQSDTDR